MIVHYVVVLLVGVGLPASCIAHSTMTKNFKVLVSSSDFPASGLKVLEEYFTVLQTKYLNFDEEGRTLAKEDHLKLIPGCSALVWCSNLLITKELLDKAGPQLKIVASASDGYNHCNLDELRARGIKLSNTHNHLTVAENVIALMLAAARRFTENLQQVHKGEWGIGFNKLLGQDIRDSTVGIIGLGNIGQAVVKSLAGFKVDKFLYTGHKEKTEAKALGAEFVTQDQLLAQSDFIVLAVPLTNETRHMINKGTLGKMKKNAIIINIGRGVVLPHIGFATVSTHNEMGLLAANNVVNALTGKALITPISL